MLDPAPNTQLFESMKKFLDFSTAKKKELGSEDTKKYVYVIERPDGMALQIVIGKFLATYYTVLAKEELEK